MDNIYSSKPAPKKPSKQYTFAQSQVLAAVITVIFLISVVWIWKNMHISSLKKEHQQSEEALIKKSEKQVE